MADRTAIEWTDASWNPIRGCSRVSSGCTGCYAETVAARFSGPGQPYEGLAKFVTNRDGEREARWTGEVRFVPEHLEDPLRWRRPRKIFVNSMSDLFHEKLDDTVIDQIMAVMTLAHWHVFQPLTKRPERMREYLSQSTAPGRVWFHVGQIGHRMKLPTADIHAAMQRVGAPLPNVWWGVSAEDQATAEERIPIMLDTPAAVRWVSAEPLLGPMDLSRFMWPVHANWPVIYRSPEEAIAAGATVRYHRQALVHADSRFLSWCVVGGESGPRARPMHPDWARSLRDQCAAAGVPFLFKQWGEWLGGEVYSGDTDHGGYARHQDGTDRGHLGKPDHWWSGDSFGGVISTRVGKHDAGRTLDGVVHDGYPAIPAPVGSLL